MKQASSSIDYEAKDKRRKLLHSQIERRRRERMSACYTQLQDLVPNLRKVGGSVQKLAILEGAVAYLLEIQRQRGQESSVDVLDFGEEAVEVELEAAAQKDSFSTSKSKVDSSSSASSSSSTCSQTATLHHSSPLQTATNVVLVDKDKDTTITSHAPNSIPTLFPPTHSSSIVSLVSSDLLPPPLLLHPKTMATQPTATTTTSTAIKPLVPRLPPPPRLHSCSSSKMNIDFLLDS